MHGLKVLSGTLEGLSVPVESKVVIGREQAQLTIDDPAISRHHAAVRPEGTALVVEDLGSVNGTFVNGQRIGGPVTLAPGDAIRVGSTEIAVELAEPPEVPTVPAGEEETPGKRRRPARALIAVGALLLAGLVAGLVLLFTRDESKSSRSFNGITIAAVASQPAPRMTILGLLRGKPTGEMSAIITREVDAFNKPGGPPVHLKLHILFSQPDGSFRAEVVGTVRVTKTGVEVVRGKADVSEGTGTYEDISGSFKIVGNNTRASQVSRFTLRGTLDY